MKTIKWLGILFLAAGLGVLGYEGIESIMAEGAPLYHYTLIDMFGEDPFSWHEKIPFARISEGIQYIVTMPAYGLFLIVGVFFLVVNGIFAR